MKILFAPFAKMIQNQHTKAGVSPKTPLYWSEFLTACHYKHPGWSFIQLSAHNEERLPYTDFKTVKIPSESEELIEDCDVWLCVDTWLQHQASHIKPGIVIWSKSDPDIFGYKNNVNLLKDRSYLRPDQWNVWANCPYDKDAFVPFEEIIEALEKFEKENKKENKKEKENE